MSKGDKPGPERVGLADTQKGDGYRSSTEVAHSEDLWSYAVKTEMAVDREGVRPKVQELVGTGGWWYKRRQFPTFFLEQKVRSA